MKTVVMTVRFTVRVPDDTYVQGLCLDIASLDAIEVITTEGELAGTPFEYETTDVSLSDHEDS